MCMRVCVVCVWFLKYAKVTSIGSVTINSTISSSDYPVKKNTIFVEHIQYIDQVTKS